LQVEPSPHANEQLPVQCTVQVEPPVQSTLPLGPTVTSHSEPPLHEMLHDSPQVPLQLLSDEQDSEQLLPLHAESPISHAFPAGQAHDVPTHSGGGGESLPQAAARTMHVTKIRRVISPR